MSRNLRGPSKRATRACGSRLTASSRPCSCWAGWQRLPPPRGRQLPRAVRGLSAPSPAITRPGQPVGRGHDPVRIARRGGPRRALTAERRRPGQRLLRRLRPRRADWRSVRLARAGLGGRSARDPGHRQRRRDLDHAAPRRPEPPVSVDFISAEVGWAVGLDSLLTTADGGRSWTALPEPCGVIRAVHFVSPQLGYAIAAWRRGLLGAENAGSSCQRRAARSRRHDQRAGRELAARAGAGRSAERVLQRQRAGLARRGRQALRERQRRPQLAAARYRRRQTGQPTPASMFVQCASGSAWALDVGPGAASSQQPHVGFFAQRGTAARPLFAELYFRPPASPQLPQAAGAYAGPMSVISTGAAAFIDSCSPCGRGYGTVPWLIATAHGGLSRRGNVADLSQPTGASFLTTSAGWVVGGLNRPARLTGTGSCAPMMAAAPGRCSTRPVRPWPPPR